MATAPTVPFAYTTLAATNPSVGPDVRFHVPVNGGTAGVHFQAGNSAIFVPGADTPGVSEITWAACAPSVANGAPTLLWCSIAAGAGLYYGPSGLSYDGT
jgi:hypothetical protein